MSSIFFFFNDTATTEIYTLSLHDALPIFAQEWLSSPRHQQNLLRNLQAPHLVRKGRPQGSLALVLHQDRKSTRLNSSHANISYAVFCLKKKKLTTWASPDPRI